MQLIYDLSGINPKVDYLSFLRAIRKVCKKTRVFKYLSPPIFNPATNLKDAKIVFVYKKDLDIVVQKIFENPLYIDGILCNLKVTFNSYDDTEIHGYQGQAKGFNRYNTPKDKPFTRSRLANSVRDRSRSPLRENPSAVDRELMMLDKQKQIIEHRQRQLRVQSESTHGQIGKHQQGNKQAQNSNPFFFFPKFADARKIIIDSGMNQIIARIVPKHQHKHVFYNLLNSQLRMKMAMALTHCKMYNYHTVKPDEVAAKYRLINPSETDEEFVLQVLEMVQHAYWPVRQKVDGKFRVMYPNDDDGVHAMVAQIADGINDVQETAEGSRSEAVHDDLLDNVELNDDKAKSNDVEAGDWTEDWN